MSRLPATTSPIPARHIDEDALPHKEVPDIPSSQGVQLTVYFVSDVLTSAVEQIFHIGSFRNPSHPFHLTLRRVMRQIRSSLFHWSPGPPCLTASRRARRVRRPEPL